MILDKTTLNDLSFLKGDQAIFSLINRCTTQAGTEVLRKHVLAPPANFDQLTEQQDAVSFLLQHADKWTKQISNGTLVMIEKFYESSDGVAGRQDSFTLFINAAIQKVFNRNAYSFVQFSIAHIIDFLRGCSELIQLLHHEPPTIIRNELEGLQQLLGQPLCVALLATDKKAAHKELMQLSYRARREIKSAMFKAIDRYARLDALQSMAVATREQGWVMPQLLPSPALHYDAVDLYHPLLQDPVAYSISFSRTSNFLFLTGANMSGKSTLIRSLGVAALLAHMGMGVPAKAMTISFLEGIITNMQVEDNIFRGESYFFAEVQRMKLTAQKLSKNRYHLVLMDELFKGTNVHDAYECSRAVIDGLLLQSDNLMALSTHLNELSDNLRERPNVWFRYCYTNITNDDQYTFTYQLKEGISRDRIGYLVLKNEGVLDLLTKK